jgi:hypothetical protein
MWRLLDASDPIVSIDVSPISVFYLELRAEKLQRACFAARPTSQVAVSFTLPRCALLTGYVLRQLQGHRTLL